MLATITSINKCRFGVPILYEGDLGGMPQFLLFDKVFISSPPSSFEEKYELFYGKLQMIKPIFIGTKLYFCCCIDQNYPNCFSDYSQLLDYLRDRLLPIFNRSRHYKFNIYFGQNASSTTTPDIIAHILQIPEINRSSRVTMKFSGTVQSTILWRSKPFLPIKAISDWLNWKPNASKVTGVGNGNRLKRILRISSTLEEYQNVDELFAHLKTVGSPSKYLLTFKLSKIILTFNSSVKLSKPILTIHFIHFYLRIIHYLLLELVMIYL